MAQTPTDDQIVSALNVLATVGERDNYTYDRLVEMLPKSKRPPSHTTAHAYIVLVGLESTDDLQESDWVELDDALRAAWKPVQVKVGRRALTVEFSKTEGY